MLPSPVERVARHLRHAWASDGVRLVALTVYYVGIIVGLAVLHGHPDFTPPPFVYQGF